MNNVLMRLNDHHKKLIKLNKILPTCYNKRYTLKVPNANISGQHNLRINLDINRIPKTKNKSLTEIVLSLAN